MGFGWQWLDGGGGEARRRGEIFFSGSGEIAWYRGTDFKLIFTRVLTRQKLCKKWLRVTVAGRGRGGAAARRDFFPGSGEIAWHRGTDFKLIFTRVLSVQKWASCGRL